MNDLACGLTIQQRIIAEMYHKANSLLEIAGMVNPEITRTVICQLRSDARNGDNDCSTKSTELLADALESEMRNAE